MRGINIDNQRPDMAVVDDVEDNENTESELLQKKLDRWIFGPFLTALERRKKVIWLGNMLQKTSLLARLSQRPIWNQIERAPCRARVCRLVYISVTAVSLQKTIGTHR